MNLPIKRYNTVRSSVHNSPAHGSKSQKERFGKILTPSNSSLGITSSTVCNKHKHAFARAGVIPYTFSKGVIYYCLGLDAKYKELTDFGGGIKKKDFDNSTAALRELQEESSNLFQNVTLTHEYFDRNMSIFLGYVAPYHLDKEFTNNPEINSIHWMPWDDLSLAVRSGQPYRIYSRIRSTLFDILNQDIHLQRFLAQMIMDERLDTTTVEEDETNIVLV